MFSCGFNAKDSKSLMTIGDVGLRYIKNQILKCKIKEVIQHLNFKCWIPQF